MSLALPGLASFAPTSHSPCPGNTAYTVFICYKEDLLPEELSSDAQIEDVVLGKQRL